MPLKLEDGKPVIQDGKVLVVDKDGKESAVDVDSLLGRVTELNGESAARRKDNDALKLQLAAFAELDPEAARKALQTVKDLDSKKLVDAGKVDEVRKAAVAEVQTNYEAKLSEAQKAQEALRSQVYGLMVSQQFSGSKALEGTTYEHKARHAEAVYGRHFRVEDGQVVGYRGDPEKGQIIFSRQDHGKHADFHEALRILIEEDPDKDHIIVTTSTGGGATGSRTGRSSMRPGSLSPDEAGKLPQLEFEKAYKEGRIG